MKKKKKVPNTYVCKNPLINQSNGPNIVMMQFTDSTGVVLAYLRIKFSSLRLLEKQKTVEIIFGNHESELRKITEV